MSIQEIIKLFGERKIRAAWDDEQEEWYFSIIDVVAVLTESLDPKAYWRKLKQRLKEEGNQTVTNCHALKMTAADGKKRLTDVATAEELFRVIQSIPSPRAEPFKVWMAQAAAERLNQLQDPERSIQQALADYRRLGYSEGWIARRLKSIEIRKDLTDEWRARGISDERDYATLTNAIYKAWSGMTAGEYKRYKGLKKQNLRDNMTNLELILSMLAEESTRQISAATQPSSVWPNKPIGKSTSGHNKPKTSTTSFNSAKRKASTSLMVGSKPTTTSCSKAHSTSSARASMAAFTHSIAFAAPSSSA